MQSKEGDVKPNPTSLDCVCFPKVVMACHAGRRSIVFAIHGLLWHAPPDVVRSCVLPKGDNGMPHPTSFDRVCYPKTMMAFHARLRSIVFAIYGL